MTDTKQQQRRKGPWPKELLFIVNQILDNFERGRDFKTLEPSIVKALRERECGLSIRGYSVTPDDDSSLTIYDERCDLGFITPDKTFAVFAKLAVDAQSQ